MIRNEPYRKNGVIYEKIYEATIYPDSTSYDSNEVIAYVQANFPWWAYILHDQDKTESGELKKPHIHLLFKSENRLSIKSVAKHLGVNENAIEWKNDFKGSVQYLTHFNAPDKFQYSVDDIVSCFADIESEFFQEKEITEAEQASKLFSFIELNHIYKMSDLVYFALQNNLYSTLRRSASIFNAMLKDNRN